MDANRSRFAIATGAVRKRGSAELANPTGKPAACHAFNAADERRQLGRAGRRRSPTRKLIGQPRMLEQVQSPQPDLRELSTSLA